MKLHWSPRSPFVRKVMVTAHEVGLAERIQTVRTMVAMDTPNAGLLADNPLSKIPTLVLDDGTVLFDSLTICEYLDSVGGGSLFPPAGPARSRADLTVIRSTCSRPMPSIKPTARSTPGRAGACSQTTWDYSTC